jgi:hypothetical protein
MDREVGDDEVGGQQQLEHVLANVALPDDLAGRAPRDAEARQRGVDEQALDRVEVDVVLNPEGADDEGSHGGSFVLVKGGV